MTKLRPGALARRERHLGGAPGPVAAYACDLRELKISGNALAGASRSRCAGCRAPHHARQRNQIAI